MNRQQRIKLNRRLHPSRLWFYPFSDISILTSLSLSCLNSSNHLHFRFDIFFLFPYTALSKPKYPRTVSAASGTISLYFSLSYSSFTYNDTETETMITHKDMGVF